MAPSTTARPARWPRGRNASRATASVFAFCFSLSAFASRPPRRAAAFTLVECLVAGTVLALFGASIAVAATQAGAANRRGDQRREAARHLDAVLTKIDLLGPGRLAVEGPLGGSLGGGDFAAAGLRDAAWSAAIALEGTWPDLYAVAVTISWTDSAGKPRAVTGHTRLYDPVGSRTVRVGWDEL